MAEWVTLPKYSHETGSLVAIEGDTFGDGGAPFDIKRVYTIFNLTPGGRRGFHAHKALQQVALCVHGSCQILLDDGLTKEEVLLDTPSRGVIIRSMVWREMFDFSNDCVLLVLASEHFDESDYIRNYEDFQYACKQTRS